MCDLVSLFLVLLLCPTHRVSIKQFILPLIWSINQGLCMALEHAESTLDDST